MNAIFQSNASTDLFDNTLTHFTNVIPDPLMLDETWRITLHSLSFDHRFSNVPPKLRTYPVMFAGQGSSGKVGYSIVDSTYNMVSLVHDMHQFFKRHKITAGLSVDRGRRSISLYGKDDCTVWMDENVVELFKLKIPPSQEQENANLVGLWDGGRQTWNVGEYGKPMYKTYIKFEFLGEEGVKYGAADAIEDLSELFPQKRPKLIKVLCDQIRPALSSDPNGYNKELATFSYDGWENTFHSFYMENKLKEFYALRNAILDKITFSLVDENDEELRLLQGQATFISVKFSKMTRKSFQLHINSSDCQNLYPNNTNSNFKIQLAEELILNGNWEVALSALHYPADFELSDFIFNEQLTLRIVRSTKEPLQITITELEEYNTDSLVTQLNKELIKQGLEQQGERVLEFYMSGQTIMARSKLAMIVTFTPLLSFLFGREHRARKIRIKATPREQMFITTELGFKFDFKHLFPHSMLLYCSIIEPILCPTGGKNYEKIIKMIPVSTFKNTENSDVSFRSQHFDWQPLALNDITSLTFKLFDSTYRDIRFRSTRAVWLTLVFREK